MSTSPASSPPPHVARWVDLIGLLGSAAELSPRGAQGVASAEKEPADADTSSQRPTPVWDVLAAEVDKALRQPGSRARVARYLAVPRQRITDYTKGRRSPDAETTLRLLHWLAATLAGQDPSLPAQSRSADPATAPSGTVKKG